MLDAEYYNNISFIIEVTYLALIFLYLVTIVILALSKAAITKLFGSCHLQSVNLGWTSEQVKKVAILTFLAQLSATKHCKEFFSCYETILSSDLFSLHFKAKRCVGNKVGYDKVVGWTSQTCCMQWHLLDVWNNFLWPVS